MRTLREFQAKDAFNTVIPHSPHSADLSSFLDAAAAESADDLNLLRTIEVEWSRLAAMESNFGRRSIMESHDKRRKEFIAKPNLTSAEIQKFEDTVARELANQSRNKMAARDARERISIQSKPIAARVLRRALPKAEEELAALQSQFRTIAARLRIPHTISDAEICFAGAICGLASRIDDIESGLFDLSSPTLMLVGYIAL
jgi:hypothetical protein